MCVSTRLSWSRTHRLAGAPNPAPFASALAVLSAPLMRGHRECNGGRLERADEGNDRAFPRAEHQPREREERLRGNEGNQGRDGDA